MEQETLIPFCPYCLHTNSIVYVHSQFHCVNCGNNVDPCLGDTFNEEIREQNFEKLCVPMSPRLLIQNSDFI